MLRGMRGVFTSCHANVLGTSWSRELGHTVVKIEVCETREEGSHGRWAKEPALREMGLQTAVGPVRALVAGRLSLLALIIGPTEMGYHWALY